LAWYLVKQLRQKEAILYEKVIALESAREKLIAEEKLAAVGRLASGIAHEIRNPVAMITSALATVGHTSADVSEREEMFAIATREAKRLELLTGDFLTYARPTKPRRCPVAISSIMQHIFEVTKLRASERLIEVECASAGEILAELDAAQIEGALLNLSLNAVDATPEKGRIMLRCRAEGRMICIDIENSGMIIPDSNLARIFEPFFTTKPRGTGLGLAIARSVARAHGGDLWVSSNGDGTVGFTMTLSTQVADYAEGENQNGEGTDSRR
jgi:signal transduction histidine kinase